MGVTGKIENLPKLFRILDKITTPNAVIIATGRDYSVGKPKKVHRDYLLKNKKRGIYPGSIKLRIEYKDYIGKWFDWLLVSRAILKKTLENTPWKIEKLLCKKDGRYIVRIGKKK